VSFLAVCIILQTLSSSVCHGTDNPYFNGLNEGVKILRNLSI
jgi:hypothetical protein